MIRRQGVGEVIGIERLAFFDDAVVEVAAVEDEAGFGAARATDHEDQWFLIFDRVEQAVEGAGDDALGAAEEIDPFERVDRLQAVGGRLAGEGGADDAESAFFAVCAKCFGARAGGSLSIDEGEADVVGDSAAVAGWIGLQPGGIDDQAGAGAGGAFDKTRRGFVADVDGGEPCEAVADVGWDFDIRRGIAATRGVCGKGGFPLCRMRTEKHRIVAMGGIGEIPHHICTDYHTVEAIPRDLRGIGGEGMVGEFGDGLGKWARFEVVQRETFELARFEAAYAHGLPAMVDGALVVDDGCLMADRTDGFPHVPRLEEAAVIGAAVKSEDADHGGRRLELGVGSWELGVGSWVGRIGPPSAVTTPESGNAKGLVDVLACLPSGEGGAGARVLRAVLGLSVPRG